MRRYSEAILSYRRATELMPTDPDVWASIGNACYVLGDFREAEEAYRESVRRDPAWTRGWYGYAVLLYTIEEDERAAVALERAESIEPGQAASFLTDFPDAADSEPIAALLQRLGG